MSQLFSTINEPETSNTPYPPICYDVGSEQEICYVQYRNLCKKTSTSLASICYQTAIFAVRGLLYAFVNNGLDADTAATVAANKYNITGNDTLISMANLLLQGAPPTTDNSGNIVFPVASAVYFLVESVLCASNPGNIDYINTCSSCINCKTLTTTPTLTPLPNSPPPPSPFSLYLKTGLNISYTADSLLLSDHQVITSVTDSIGASVLIVNFFTDNATAILMLPNGTELPAVHISSLLGITLNETSIPAVNTVAIYITTQVVHAMTISSAGSKRKLLRKLLDNPGCDWWPDTACSIPCCAQHDKCYHDNGCTFETWIFEAASVCKECNYAAADCIEKSGSSTCDECAGGTSVKGKTCYDAKCDTFYDCPGGCPCIPGNIISSSTQCCNCPSPCNVPTPTPTPSVPTPAQSAPTDVPTPSPAQSAPTDVPTPSPKVCIPVGYPCDVIYPCCDSGVCMSGYCRPQPTCIDAGYPCTPGGTPCCNNPPITCYTYNSNGNAQCVANGAG